MPRRQPPREIPAPVRRTLTVREAAAMAGIGESTIRDRVARGVCEFPVRRVGRRILVPVIPFCEYFRLPLPDWATP